MADPLLVDTADVFSKAQAIGNHAEDLRAELQSLVTGWEDVSHTWQGSASEAYGPIFERWHQNAVKLVDSLAGTSQQLMSAAVAYEERDATNAQSVDSAGGAF